MSEEYKGCANREDWVSWGDVIVIIKQRDIAVKALEELLQESVEELNLHCTYVRDVCEQALKEIGDE